MLSDLTILLDRSENERFVEDDFYQAASLIRRKQFIWAGSHGQSKHYNLVMRFQEYFTNLFNAFGDEFVINNHFGYCGVMPKYQQRKMKALETVFLLILAKLYDSEARKACIENGRAQPSPSLLIETYMTLTGKEKPKYSDTMAALKLLSSSGIILLGEKDEVSELPTITVLPTISVILSEQYIVLLEQFTQAKNTEDDLVTEEIINHE
jgi:hypothetical protein